MTIIDFATDVVLTATCKERSGLVERTVRPMLYTPENLNSLWEKSRNLRTVFGVQVREDYKKFLELFISQEGNKLRAHGLFWVIDDFVGVYYMTHITDIDAQVHYIFFDRTHEGRVVLTKKMLSYAFGKFGFWRLSTEVPSYVRRHVFDFVREIGFKKEGVKRDACEYNGLRHDVITYGLLNEEADKWE